MRARTAFHTRTAIIAVTGVLAIIGASVLGGALVASAAADSVTITTPNNSVDTFGLVTINGGIDWAVGGGSIVVQVENEDNVITNYCTGSSYLATDTVWGCGGVPLSMGVNTITAIADDGAGTVTSNTITYIRGGSADPTITENNVSFQSTTTVLLHGTGPEMGTVNVLGYKSFTGSPPGDQYCTAAPVDRFGDWTCTLIVPDLDLYSFYAIGYDVLEPSNQTLNSPTVQLDFVPAKPSLAVTALPTGLSVEATSAPDGDAVGIFVDHWNTAGVNDVPRVYCPAGWNYSGTLPTNTVEPCTIGAPAAGSYLVSSNSFANYAYSTNRGDLIRIPNTPVLTSATPQPDGTVDFVGTVSSAWTGPFATADGGSEATVVTTGGIEICTGAVDVSQNFTCSGAAPSGNQTFHSYATSVNFQGSPASLDGYYDGSSGFSNSQAALVAAGQHVQITSPANGSSQVWAAGPNLTISGTAALAGTVDVTVNGAVPANCDDIVPTLTVWTCTITVTPGVYTMIASMTGSLDSSAVTTTVSIPAPVIDNDDPLEVTEGDIASLFGSVPFANGTIMATIDGEYYCDDTTFGGGLWGCPFDTGYTPLTPGDYTLTVWQSYPGAPSVTTTMTLRVVAQTADIVPTLTCAFTPGGGISVTGSQYVDARLFALQPGTGDPAENPGACSGNAGNLISNLGPYVGWIQWCTPTCTQTLAPGVYYVYYNHGDSAGAGYDFSPYNYFFTIPTNPTVTKVSDTGRATGTGTAGDRIRLVNGSGAQICTTVVAAAGTWTCAVTLTSKQGIARAYQVDAASGGMSAYSTAVTLPTLEVPPPTIAPRPWTVHFGDTTEYHPGDPVVIDGADAPPNSLIDAELHSTPVLLGSTVADAFGNFTISTTIPMDAEPGDHHIVLIATPTDGSAPIVLEQPVSVVVDDAPATDDNAVGSGLVPGSVAARQQPGGISALSSTGLVAPSEILGDPVALATAGSLGLALVLLVLVPAEFFGEALANHYGPLGGFSPRRQKLKRVFERVGNWIEENRFLAGAALVFVTSVVFCFVDPGFGFDLTSLRLLLSCAVSILLVNFLSAGITERVAEKAWHVPTRLEVMPWGLAIAIVGVIASRVLNFSPGFLIGSIIGVSVIGEVSKRLETRVILLWSAVVWAVAMVAWVLAPLVPSLPAGDSASFFTSLLSDSLTATAAAGLTALLVALLPIALFDGGVLFKNSKLRWAIAFGIAVASFSIVVLPSASNWLGLGDGLFTWLLLTLAFIAVAVITYALAVRHNRRGGSRLVKARTEA